MPSAFMSFISACLWPNSDVEGRGGSDPSGSGSGGQRDGLLWYKDVGQHVYGDFSMAAVQANNIIEDQSQIESGSLSTLDSGPFGTLVGIYDGHGGADTSRHINHNLFNHLKRFCSEHQSMSVDVIRKTVQATEEGFLSVVSKHWPLKPQIAAVGSCCLLGILCDGKLFVANLGDSRAVMGKLTRATGGIQAVQLSREHNASAHNTFVMQMLRISCTEPTMVIGTCLPSGTPMDEMQGMERTVRCQFIPVSLQGIETGSDTLLKSVAMVRSRAKIRGPFDGENLSWRSFHIVATESAYRTEAASWFLDRAIQKPKLLLGGESHYHEEERNCYRDLCKQGTGERTGFLVVEVFGRGGLDSGGSGSGGQRDGLLWYKDVGQHVYGDFSMAAVQANNIIEDQSQIESGSLSTLDSGPFGTLVGIYDGHGGADTSRHINHNLFNHLKRFCSEHQSMSVDVIRKTVQATEEGFLSVVSKHWPLKPQIAAVGSCCLLGILCDGKLFVANLGDSRAVMGKLTRATGGIQAVQLSREHNARFCSEHQSMSVDVIRKAVQATEEGFLSVISKQWPLKPQIAAVGSCCLLGIVCDGKLFVANLGDSRAVMGELTRATGGIQAVQLSREHNASMESERRALRFIHPDDPNIVILRHNVWRVKGIIQITRSIGDVYLKKPEYNKEPLNAKFRLAETFKRPLLSSEPSISVHELQPEDLFIIFASDGLWEHLSNQEAVDIVHSCSHKGSARKLVKAALQRAAKKREVRYSDLMKIERGVRRHFHDDISVVVLFLDSNAISRATAAKGPQLSLKAGGM
ncbi:putative protein phosphatase 2C 28 [Drosera capensis]